MSKLLVGETCENITQVNAGWHKCEYTTHLVKVWLVTNVTREQMWGWPAREGCLAQPHQAAAAAAAAAKKLQEFQIFLAKQQQRHQSAQQRSSQEKRCTRWQFTWMHRLCSPFFPLTHSSSTLFYFCHLCEVDLSQGKLVRKSINPIWSSLIDTDTLLKKLANKEKNLK